MTTSEIKNRIGCIKEGYGFNMEKIWRIPDENFKMYGYPASIDRVNNGYLVLFNQWPSCAGTLLFYSQDFQQSRIIRHSPFLYRSCYHPLRGTILCVETDYFNFYNNNRDKALSNPGNRIIECDFEGNVLKEFGSLVKDETFFPTEICIWGNDSFIYYDFAQNRIVIMTFEGEAKHILNTGRKFIRRVRISESGDIYFIAIPHLVGAVETEFDEVHETIYKIGLTQSVSDEKPGVFFENLEGNERNEKNLYDIEIMGGNIFCSPDKSLIKINSEGKTVYRLSLPEGLRDRDITYDCRFTILKRSVWEPNICYAVLEAYRGTDFWLCKLEI